VRKWADTEVTTCGIKVKGWAPTTKEKTPIPVEILDLR
jgi:hypothetical protein